MQQLFTAVLCLLVSCCNLTVMEKTNFDQKDVPKKETLLTSLSSLIINGVDSTPRLFYARLLYGEQFCGATILSDRFFLTAGHCVNKLRHQTNLLKLEVGDFSQKNSLKKLYSIESIFVNTLYIERGQMPRNDIALVKTEGAIENGDAIAIRLCEDSMITEDMDKTIIGFCGMGSISTKFKNLVIPEKLQQMIFKQTVLYELNQVLG